MTSPDLQLRRLEPAVERHGDGPGPAWSQTFGYDNVGNRWLSGGLQIDQFTPTGNGYDGNNHMSGLQYADGRGNVTQIGGYTYQYDAENRLIASTLSSYGQVIASATYSYDGDGRRVMKQQSGGVATHYVYDAQGNLAVENTVSGTPPGVLWGTAYQMGDHLGSLRMQTDSNGDQRALWDYAPFGEELTGADGRDARWGGPGTGFHFTGKEQEGAEGDYMHYFGARYYAAGLGRFTSADELLVGVEFENPQSWNRYAYVLNNPLKYIDPTGHEPCENGFNPENGNICTVVVAPKERPAPKISPFDVPGQWFAGFVDLFLNEKPSGAARMAYAYAAQLAPGPVMGVFGEAASSSATLAKYMNILRQAARLKGNFGLGEATAEEALEVGQAWVGGEATLAGDGKTLVSADGLRQFRPPSFKPNLGKVQANFESRPVPSGQWQTNGHLDVK